MNNPLRKRNFNTILVKSDFQTLAQLAGYVPLLKRLRFSENFIADRALVLYFKNAFKIAEKTMPRRKAPRQPLLISLNVKLGGVF